MTTNEETGVAKGVDEFVGVSPAVEADAEGIALKYAVESLKCGVEPIPVVIAYCAPVAGRVTPT
jgi:hypothetical protein